MVTTMSASSLQNTSMRGNIKQLVNMSMLTSTSGPSGTLPREFSMSSSPVVTSAAQLIKRNFLKRESNPNSTMKSATMESILSRRGFRDSNNESVGIVEDDIIPVKVHTRAKWLQPASTLFSILGMFGVIMLIVLCNVCVTDKKVEARTLNDRKTAELNSVCIGDPEDVPSEQAKLNVSDDLDAVSFV